MSGQFSLPAPESCRWVIESTRPGDEIFHASGRQQRALRVQAVYSDIFRIGDHSLLSKRRRFRRNCLQANRTHSRHCCESAAAFFLPFGLVEIRDALFGYDMAHVIALDHYGLHLYPSLLAHLHRVESLNERRNAAFLKGLYGLYHELSTANDGLALRYQIKPCWCAVPPSMGVVSHVRGPADPGQRPLPPHRGVRAPFLLTRR